MVHAGSDKRIGIDVGGTFTDLIVLSGGEVRTFKVPTSRDQADGVLEALNEAGVDPESVDAISHGTTIATNALLERLGARTALITTRGFRDVIEIARQNRASLYDLTVVRQPALVPRELRLTVSERVDSTGIKTPLDEDDLRAACDALETLNAQSVAVCYLFSWLHPEHERATGRALAERFPEMSVSLSCDVLPEFREYERTSTTVANAYLAPLLGNYLRKVERRVTERGLPNLLVMQSSGGVIDSSIAAERAASCVLSGPAGGVVGAAFIAEACGYDNVLSFDMGGTSTDVAPIVDGRVEVTTESVVAGVALKLPMVDVHTVGAGGGSVARIDDGGALQVGPESAGADPGPACYGRGGNDPTVTDANVTLGYIADGAAFGGSIKIDAEQARDAMTGIRLPGESATEAIAGGVLEVANATMAQALRVISVQRGLDPREFALVAFGGAGPLHACKLADALGMRTVLVPAAGGVLSALGLGMADVRRDYVQSLRVPIDDLDRSAPAAFAALDSQAGRDLPGHDAERSVDLRYEGQSYEITVSEIGDGPLPKRFHEAHRKRFGYAMEDHPVEAVAVRLVATRRSTRPMLGSHTRKSSATRTRRAHFGEWVDVPVLDGNALTGSQVVEGPSIVEYSESTCVVSPGWSGAVEASGTLILEKK
jgi:N-methylhydantoinase A